jgi:signal transduction histidine kinase
MGDSGLFAQATLDNLSAHIAIVDGSGTIVAVNRAWREFARANGAESNVMEGASYLEVCDSATGAETGYAAAFAEGVRAALAGRREEFTLEYPCHSPTERRWFIGRVTSFRNSDGSPLAVIAHENVTKRKLAEEALERTLEARTQFMADVSHELRTLLTVIRGNVDVGMQLDAGSQREILAEIGGEAERMSRMVDDLLLLARSDSESLPLNLETIPVLALLGELARRAEALARERRVPLRTALAGEGSLDCDVERIEQAALILVDNAAKYGTANGAPDGAKISLSSRTLPGELAIEVSDSGPGIPPEELPRIFERFYRGEGSSGKRGSGLGLPIARTIAEAHGGRIEARSRVGEGTTVTLYLPSYGDP